MLGEGDSSAKRREELSLQPGQSNMPELVMSARISCQRAPSRIVLAMMSQVAAPLVIALLPAATAMTLVRRLSSPVVLIIAGVQVCRGDEGDPDAGPIQ